MLRDIINSLLFFKRYLEGLLGFDDERKMIGLVFPEGDSEIVIHNDASMPSPSFSFLVADVEGFCLDYKKRGYKVIQEPIVVRCGKYAILADPDGNELPIIDLTRFGNKPRYDLKSI